jgi:hypothetical protein
MKAQPITDTVKRDWRLLRLRATYDPKRFYKVMHHFDLQANALDCSLTGTAPVYLRTSSWSWAPWALSLVQCRLICWNLHLRVNSYTAIRNASLTELSRRAEL